MKIIDTILTLPVFLSCVILSYYFLFNNPFAFTFEFNNYGQYFAAFVVLSCWSLFLILGLFLNKMPHFEQGLVMLVATVFILYLLFSQYYSFANEYFTNITVAILLYAMLLSAGVGVLHSLLIFFAVTFFWQLYLAFKQMGQMNGFSLNIQRLSIRGAMQHSGIFSWYIVSQLPFLYYLFFCLQVTLIPGKKLSISKRARLFVKSLRVIVFAIIFALVVSIIWQSQSRTATIALGVMLLSFFILHYGKAAYTFIYKLPGALNLLMAGALLAGLTYGAWYLFNLKKLSSITRVMTLDIARDHLMDHFWLGTGIGRFSWYYPQWQARYFAMHPHPPTYYFLSAGESYYLFNEYVELFCAVGLPGVIAFVLVLIWFFTRRSTRHYTLLNAAKLTMIAVLVCGISSYSFHVTFLLLLLAFCFAVAAIVSDNHWSFSVPGVPDPLRNTVAWLLPVVFIVIAGLGTYSAFGQWQAKQDWDKLRNRLDGSRAEIKAEYARLNKLLPYDGKFLTDYGMTLLEDSADCEKAVMVLEEAKIYFISKVTLETLAQAYKKKGDYKKAIENYEWLCQYLPNRFGPKLELLKLYRDSRDTINARKTGNMILTMPVKLRSHEVDRIKDETKIILHQMQ